MTQTIGFTELKKMLLAAVETIRTNKDELCKLDGVCGDGDHGVAVTRAMEAIEAAIHDYQGENIADFVKAAGWGVMSIDGGSTGPLFGSFFMGMNVCRRSEESSETHSGAAGRQNAHRHARSGD